MCGIFGIAGKRLNNAERVLRAGTRALAHRGPDDEGLEIVSHPSETGPMVALGARRLAIQDLSPAGHQPMQDPATGNWVVFNGEIYNFHVLRKELERLGHRFHSHGDTEVLLKAYGEWGDACVERLAGMFALAIWDARRQRLFLARDRFGVKPLYYFEADSRLAFASEVRSLLATGLVPRRLDHAGLASYLAFGAVQDPLTIVESVRSLLPGHTMTWEGGRRQIRGFWSLARAASRPAFTDSPSEAVSAIRERLLEAVSQRLIADVPLGIFLSGGLDSSVIVAMTREVSAEPPHTFSVVFGSHGYCEGKYSDCVARTFGCRHHRIQLTHAKLLEEIPRALAAMDQPTVDGMNTYIVSEATKRAGITVALSGLGGDEVFGGYSSFLSVPKMMKFRRHAAWLEPLGRGMHALLGQSQTNRFAKMVALGSGQYFGGHPYFLSRALFAPRSIRALFPSFPMDNAELGRLWNLGAVAEEVRSLDAHNQVSVLEGSTYMANMLLRDTDCMSMAHSMEVREPLLDHRVWEYVLPLAARLKHDPRTPKQLLLRAAGQSLPQETYRRPKMGFTLPFESWLRDGLGDVVGRELLGASPGELLPLAPRPVAEVWEAFRNGNTSWSRPWALYVLKRWVDKNIGDRHEDCH